MAYVKTVRAGTIELPPLRESRTLQSGDPEIGSQCPTCDGDFAEGEIVSEILLGCGDPTCREDALARRPYSGTWIMVHRMCIIGT